MPKNKLNFKKYHLNFHFMIHFVVFESSVERGFINCRYIQKKLVGERFD